MKTRVLPVGEKSAVLAADLLKRGNIVGIPTETVYGLAANAYDEKAVEKIFIAKGRPQDNPLIVHISNLDMLDGIVASFTDEARRLARVFWPGPLTIILPKAGKIAANVSGGLDTIAVRMPSHSGARLIIEKSGLPLAAPSANISGSPSPTSAKHVLNDLKGKIPLIIDGGPCEIGLESTVISLAGANPIIYRPGKITAEEISQALSINVQVDKSAVQPLGSNEKAESPGTKYKHYSPKANLFIVRSDLDTFINYINKHKIKDAFALCFEGEEKKIPLECVTYGVARDSASQAERLFSALRELDELGAKTVYARFPIDTGEGLAVYNRLLRAAAFKIIDPEILPV